MGRKVGRELLLPICREVVSFPPLADQKMPIVFGTSKKETTKRTNSDGGPQRKISRSLSAMRYATSNLGPAFLLRSAGSLLRGAGAVPHWPAHFRCCPMSGMIGSTMNAAAAAHRKDKV
jgi:hypothetical protein